MKNVFKKGLVVLLASLFVTGVFAAETTTVTTESGAAPVAQHAHVAKKAAHKHCMKNCKASKKACKKACKHHKNAVKKAGSTETTTPAAEATK